MPNGGRGGHRAMTGRNAGVGGRTGSSSRRKQIEDARAAARKRKNKRTRHGGAYTVTKNKARKLDAKRRNKQRQIASLKRQGRHEAAAEAQVRYGHLSEDFARAHHASKAHARKAVKHGAGKGNFKDVYKGRKAPVVKTAAELRDAGKGGHVVHYKGAPGRKSRASAPSVGSGKKKPKSTTPKVKKLTKEQYKTLVKNRQKQADANWGKYGTDDAKRKKSAGQKLYNSYDKKLKNSQYSYRSHVAAMKRRGKKATAATYAKFKRYNGI